MIFARLRDSLKKTRDKLVGGLSGLFGIQRELNDEFLRELESVLYSADLGTTGLDVLNALRADYRDRKLATTDDVRVRLRELLRQKLGDPKPELVRAASGPTVVLIVGVNGSGKTTSVAKLAQRLVNEKKKVMVAACDTFRAAAVEQLSLWAERVGVPVIKKQAGADPAAVAFDAAVAAASGGIDVLVIDTAGRLHTREDLMAELGKVRRVLDKRLPGAPHETLLVLDATTGQNAIRQAEVFTQVVPLTGVILAKLDGTARGGAVVSIRDRLGIPVRFAGTGEKADDLEPFDPERFLDALLQE
jgi:fused signal recognition particle receptor